MPALPMLSSKRRDANSRRVGASRIVIWYLALLTGPMLAITPNATATEAQLRREPVVISVDDPNYETLRSAARLDAFRKRRAEQPKPSGASRETVIGVSAEGSRAAVVNRKPTFIFSERPRDKAEGLAVSAGRERAAADVFNRIMESKR